MCESCQHDTINLGSGPERAGDDRASGAQSAPMAQDDTTSAYAAPDPQDAAFQAYLQTVAAKARAQGIRDPASARSWRAHL
jgi:hypothetical protein